MANREEDIVAHRTATLTFRNTLEGTREIKLHTLSGLHELIGPAFKNGFTKNQKEMLRQVIQPGFFDPNSRLCDGLEALLFLRDHKLLSDDVLDDIIEQAEIDISVHPLEAITDPEHPIFVGVGQGGSLLFQISGRHGVYSGDQYDIFKAKVVEARDAYLKEHPEHRRYSDYLDRDLRIDNIISARAAAVPHLARVSELISSDTPPNTAEKGVGADSELTDFVPSVPTVCSTAPTADYSEPIDR